LAAALLAFGFVTRPEWGISKNLGTPSWVAICAAISTLSFLVIYLIADVWKKTSWAALVAPAGRSTLTCYLVPYWFYPIFMVTIAAVLPSWATEGLAGIAKSLLFSLLVIYITSLLEKVNIRLKV
jgi:predicted acyltransferase